MVRLHWPQQWGREYGERPEERSSANSTSEMFFILETRTLKEMITMTMTTPVRGSQCNTRKWLKKGELQVQPLWSFQMTLNIKRSKQTGNRQYRTKLNCLRKAVSFFCILLSLNICFLCIISIWIWTSLLLNHLFLWVSYSQFKARPGIFESVRRHLLGAQNCQCAFANLPWVFIQKLQMFILTR